MLKRLFSRSQEDDLDASALSYEEQRARLEQGGASDRLHLAGSRGTRPEILYFLAKDESSAVRCAIAGNDATPVQADQILVEDGDVEVRSALAEKIARLVPEMPDDEQEKIRELTYEILEQLARDSLPRVRAAVSEQIKHAEGVPKHIVSLLAMDMEDIVAAPILEYSPLLDDDDLLEIIRLSKTEASATAIARRANLGAQVADAVARTCETGAVAALLANDSAQLREDTLDRIIDQAQTVTPWHEPLVRRPKLPMKAVRKLSGFVAQSLVRMLSERNDLDPSTTDYLLEVVEERFAGEADTDGEAEDDSDESQVEQARALHKKKMLDDEAVQIALEDGRTVFATEALMLLSGLPQTGSRKLLRSGQAKPVTALVWKCGLGMRTAMQVQRHIAKIAPHNVLNARNGTDYPLTPEEMQWQIDNLS
tara:strand:+ start:1565 stop:2836 length:1272 start_codon:yes stop_codon:yes gene_type:complete